MNDFICVGVGVVIGVVWFLISLVNSVSANISDPNYNNNSFTGETGMILSVIFIICSVAWSLIHAIFKVY